MPDRQVREPQMNFLTMIFPLAGKIIDLITSNSKEAQAYKTKLLELAQEGQLKELELAAKQLEVNAAEAASGSIWNSGWRPAIGWVCAAVFAWNFLLFPFIFVIAALFSVTIPNPVDIGPVMTVMTGMLGLGMGALRSYDKKLNRKAFFDTLRKTTKQLNQAEVENLNRALDRLEE